MNLTQFRIVISICCFFLLIPSGFSEERQTNFVIVLADDLGYGDLACFGNETIMSPNLDRFAKQGMRLTSCYSAAPNCSPSRAGLLTGRTPYRVGIHNWIPSGSPMHVTREEITIATLLKQAGYETCHVGKWHLNGQFNSPDQPQPDDHGFQHWFATQNNALPSHENPDNFVRNGKPVGKLAGYSAGIVAREAIDWLNKIRDTTKPFFLFVCFHEPHEPIAAEKRFTDLYPFDGDPSPFDPRVSKRAAHHGNVTQMDEAFGRLMTAIDELQLRDNTFAFFTSDNGPAITAWHPHGSPGPFRDKKGYSYEGGIRVPGIVRWPGNVPASTTSAEPISGVDLLPTICEIAQIEPANDRKLDGTSFTPVFKQQEIKRETPLYWQFNFAQGRPRVAMRVGNWKILAEISQPLKAGGDILAVDQQAIKTAELERFELYDLLADVNEAKNLWDAQPERAEKMATQLKQLYIGVRNESPIWPEWKWPRAEGKRIKDLIETKKLEAKKLSKGK